jgi:Lantibiotic dehydratase, N terminus
MQKTITTTKHRMIEGCVTGGLLPYVVIRHAGLSAERFETLVFPRTSSLMDRYLEQEMERNNISRSLPDGLEQVIGTVGGGALRSELLQLRRDIHNGRFKLQPLAPETWAVLNKALSAAEREQLNQYVQSCSQRMDLLIEGERAFAEELKSARAVLKSIFRKREFRKALALASPSLSYELGKYLCAPEEDLRRIRRTELSLVRYYTRGAFKVSPFSRFSRSSVVRISENARASHQPLGRLSSCVTLNRSLIATLAECVARHPDLRGHVPVCLSGAYSENGQRLVLLQRQYNGVAPTRMRIPREATVCVSLTKAMEWIRAYLGSHGGQAPFNHIVLELGQSLDAPAEALSYVEKLIDIGFLVHKIRFGNSESAGLEVLIAFLSSIPCPVAQELRSCLEALGQIAARISTAASEERVCILRQLEIQVAAAFKLLNVDSASRWNGLIAFEDCGEDSITQTALPARWKPILEDLNSFLSLYAPLLDWNLSLRMAMAHILGNDLVANPVDFLEFVHAFAQGPSKTPSAQDVSNYHHTPNTHGLSKVRQLGQLRDEICRVVAESSGEEEVDLLALGQSHGWFQRLSDLQVGPYEPAVMGIAVHGQATVQADGSLNLVINAIYDGAVNILLRACNTLSPGSREQLVCEISTILRDTWTGGMLCEILASHDFNVNLHPRITELAVDCAEEDKVTPENFQIKDLQIKRAPDQRISLAHRESGTEIIPLATGMMSMSFAPLTQHLLSTFSSTRMISSRPFHPFSWSLPAQEESVRCLPRMVFGRCILRRRAWLILREALPLRAGQDTDFGYFLQVRRWQRTMGIPDEVFATIEPYAGGESEAHEGSRQSWNRRKPQYIDFRNFFLVDVLAKLISEVRTRLYIEEMLPGRTDWDHWSLHRPTELILNFLVARDEEQEFAGRVPESTVFSPQSQNGGAFL